MKKSMVLVTISDNSNRIKIKSILEPHYFVVEASNLRQAEILIGQNNELIRSIILSDDIDYLPVVNAYKSNTRKPSIIIVGYAMDLKRLEKVKLDGISGFVNYSVKKEETLNKIEKIFAENESQNIMRDQMIKQANSRAKVSKNDETEAFGSFRIDLEKRVLCNQAGFISDFMIKNNIKSLKELIGLLSKHLVYFNKDKFIEIFAFENILDTITQGKKPIKLNELFNFSNHVYCLEITVSSFTDIANGSSFALILFNDTTTEYQEKRLESGIFEKEYDLIARINAYTQMVNVQFNNGPYDVPLEKIILYSDLQKEIVKHFSQDDVDKEILHKKLDIDTIVENLDDRSLYDIITILNQKKMIFYRIIFRYLDEFQESIIVYIENITGLKEIDFITGSLNYHGFLNKSFEEMYQSTKKYSVINCCCTNYKDLFEFISVDSINLFLKDFNKALKRSDLKPICIGRSSSDTFWLLVETKNIDIESLKTFGNIAIKGDNKLFYLSVNFGIYNIPESIQVNSAIDIDLFCERSKMVQSYLQTNRNTNYAFFDQTISDEHLKKASIVNDVLNALEREEFEVYYQPIYDANKQYIVAAEALLRWKHKEYGFVPPDMLIPAIEANGLVSRVDNYVISKTDKFLNKLHEKGCYIPISVNLSRLDFYDGELVNNIIEIAKRTQDYKHMNFEVTESYYIELSSSINQIISELKEYGSRILLDDFGDGFSSFRALITTDFDIIKIYKGMIDQIGVSKISEEAIKAIINMAHSVGLYVVAEGVEVESQLKFLKKNKCDFIQGFIFSKPIPENEFYRLIVDHKKSNF